MVELTNDGLSGPDHGTDRARRQRAAGSVAPSHRLSRRDQSRGEGRQHRRHGQRSSRQAYRENAVDESFFADEAAECRLNVAEIDDAGNAGFYGVSRASLERLQTAF